MVQSGPPALTLRADAAAAGATWNEWFLQHIYEDSKTLTVTEDSTNKAIIIEHAGARIDEIITAFNAATSDFVLSVVDPPADIELGTLTTDSFEVPFAGGGNEGRVVTLAVTAGFRLPASIRLIKEATTAGMLALY